MNISKKQHFYWLDSLRFVAALWVVFVHSRQFVFVDYINLPANQHSILTTVFYLFNRVGEEIVLVFFVLSGFLVGGSVIAKVKENTFDAFNYFLDRFTRLFIPLLGALILTTIISILLNNPIDIVTLLGNLLSLQGIFVDVYGGNGPLWSLGYEVWFYILAGTIASVILKKGKKILVMPLLVISLLVFLKLNFVYLFAWCVGALFYHSIEDHKSITRLILSVTLTLLFVGVTQLTRNCDYQLGVITISKDVSMFLLSVSIAFFIKEAVVFKPLSPLSCKIEHLGSILASFSYTLYLVHYPVIHLVTKLMQGSATSFTTQSIVLYFANVIISVLLAIIMYFLFERNTFKVKKWVKNKFAKG